MGWTHLNLWGIGFCGAIVLAIMLCPLLLPDDEVDIMRRGKKK
jgi:hypothetical protein